MEPIKYDHLSYSSVSQFEACPKQFELAKRAKAPSNEAMEAGKEMHEKLADDLRKNAVKPSVGGRKLAAFFHYTLPGATGVEEKFELDVMGQKYVGAIDAYLDLGKIMRIVDWKSYRSGFVNEKQLKIYALTLLERYPAVEMFECFFFYVNQDAYDRFEWLREEIEAFGEELYDLTVKVRSTEVFQETPGGHCSNCQYTNECPTAKTMHIIKCDTPEAAVKMAKNLFAAQALCDQAHDLLKDYMIDNGLEEITVTEKDRYYLYSPSPQLKSGKLAKEKKSTGERIKKIKEMVEKKEEESKNA